MLLINFIFPLATHRLLPCIPRTAHSLAQVVLVRLLPKAEIIELFSSLVKKKLKINKQIEGMSNAWQTHS